MRTDATSVLNGTLPEISTTEPNSPIARAKPSAVPVEHRGRQVRQDDPAQDRDGRRAERGGRLLHVAVELEQHRLHGADDERQRDEQQGEHDRRPACRRGSGRTGSWARTGSAASGPATIVGSANGRSISELTELLPGKSSRTSIQAMIVPITALIATTMSASVKVSLIAATD